MISPRRNQFFIQMSHALAFHEGFAAGVRVGEDDAGLGCWSIGTETDSELDLEEEGRANEVVPATDALSCSLLLLVETFSWGYDSSSSSSLSVQAGTEEKVLC